MTDSGQVPRLPKGPIEVVYAFILGFVPQGLIAVEKPDGRIFLPGGVVEGLGEPPVSSEGSHFLPLRFHVRQQTGLELVAISDAVVVQLFEGELGSSMSLGSSHGRAHGRLPL